MLQMRMSWACQVVARGEVRSLRIGKACPSFRFTQNTFLEQRFDLNGFVLSKDHKNCQAAGGFAPRPHGL